jgi:hypothetical protein
LPSVFARYRDIGCVVENTPVADCVAASVGGALNPWLNSGSVSVHALKSSADTAMKPNEAIRTHAITIEREYAASRTGGCVRLPRNGNGGSGSFIDE